MIRILIADDHAVVRQGIRQILALDPDLAVVDEAADGWQLIEKLRNCDCELLLTDLSMPGPSGLALLERVRKERPGLPLLVLSIHGESQNRRHSPESAPSPVPWVWFDRIPVGFLRHAARVEPITKGGRITHRACLILAPMFLPLACTTAARRSGRGGRAITARRQFRGAIPMMRWLEVVRPSDPASGDNQGGRS